MTNRWRSLTLLVIAKEPLPGSVKTRLIPALGPQRAALVAEAALSDTLATVAVTPAHRRVVVLEGNPGPWLPPGFEIVPQVSGCLGTRLAAAFAALDGPGLGLGMDTPQVRPDDLDLRHVEEAGASAAFGPARDGGYWALGMVEPDPEVFDGVAMSTSQTARHQRDRLVELGHRIVELPTLRDVDTIDDAVAVARAAPHTTFARTLHSLAPEAFDLAHLEGGHRIGAPPAGDRSLAP